MAVLDDLKRLAPSFRPTEPRPRRDLIAALEREFAGPLPPDYAEALLAWNSPMMLTNRVQPDRDAGKSEFNLESLFPLQDARETVFDANRTYAGRLAPGLIAIGRAGGGGDLICLDVAGLLPGTVYYWDHEKEVDRTGARQPDYAPLTRLAASFSALLGQTIVVEEKPMLKPGDVVSANLRFKLKPKPRP